MSSEAAAWLLSAERLLVVSKFRYLGDTIVATPMLRALKTSNPNARITLLAGPTTSVLVAGLTSVDDVISLSPTDSRGLRGQMQFARDLRVRQFDGAFLLNRSLHSAALTWAARVPVRVGFATEHRGPFLTVPVRYDWTKPDRDCALDLLTAAGVQAEPGLPELTVTGGERAEARELVARLGYAEGRPLISIQPGANDAYVREWGARRFAAAANVLAERLDAHILIMGSADELEAAQATAAALQCRHSILAGETSLRQALACISLCRLWVGNDGGMLHAAVALGPATVGIFGPTKAARWGYNTPRHRTVVHGASAGDATPMDIRASLDAVTVDEVIAAALGAWKAG